MKNSESSCEPCGSAPNLVFSCSGAADVGLIADQAARKLTRDGVGKMFCLAGIGGRVPGILATTRSAARILAIDGCPTACVKHCLEEAGFDQFEHLQLADLGLQKGESPVSEARIARVCEESAALLAS